MKKGRDITIISLTFLLVFAVIEFLSRFGLVNRYFLPAPTFVIATMFKEPDFIFGNMAVSLVRILVAYAIGTSLGLLFGIAVGWYRHIESTVGSMLNALYSIPKLTFLPLFILWLGLGNITFLSVAILSAFFPVYMNTYSGVKKLDKSYIEMYNNFRGKRNDILRKIVLPATMPYISTGLRMSIGHTLTIVTVTEMVMAENGIGAVIWRGGELFRAEYIFAGQILLAVTGVLLFFLYDIIERKRILNWMNLKENGTQNKKHYQEL